MKLLWVFFFYIFFKLEFPLPSFFFPFLRSYPSAQSSCQKEVDPFENEWLGQR